ncbi:MAG: hypothetical protein QM775_14215 [Pirellulales bacterium]
MVIVMNSSEGQDLPPPDDGPQRDYREAILDILSGIKFDNANVPCGVGLLTYLTYGGFVGAGINIITHPDAGSRSSNAELITEIFAPVRQSRYWWEDQYRESDQRLVTQWYDWWREQFRSSPLVTKVDFW